MFGDGSKPWSCDGTMAKCKTATLNLGIKDKWVSVHTCTAESPLAKIADHTHMCTAQWEFFPFCCNYSLGCLIVMKMDANVKQTKNFLVKRHPFGFSRLTLLSSMTKKVDPGTKKKKIEFGYLDFLGIYVRFILYYSKPLIRGKSIMYKFLDTWLKTLPFFKREPSIMFKSKEKRLEVRNEILHFWKWRDRACLKILQL